MAGNKEIAIGLFAAALVLAFIALFGPWWTFSASMEGMGGGSDSNSAGPFDKGTSMGQDMISSGSAALTGIFTLLAVLLFAAAAGLLVFGLVTKQSNAVTNLAPFAGLAGAAFLVIAIVLAIFMYPSELNSAGGDFSFWWSESGEGMSMSTYAAWGWYLGIVGVIAGAAGGVMAMRKSEDVPASTGATGSGG